MKTLFFSLLTILLYTTGTNAQVEAVVMSSTTLDRNDKETTSKAYILEDKVLTESSGDRDGAITLFDAGQETFYIINHKKKEYTEMTREDMEALSAMVGEQMKMLEQQLANLPEAQREAVRKQMSASFGQQQQESIDYQKEASGEMVEGWRTEKYVGMEGDQKKSEIYIASYEDLGQDKSDFKALEKFFSMMQDFAKAMNQNTPITAFGFFDESMPAFTEGIPVKSIFYNDQGEIFTSSTISSIEEESVDEALFEIPENYKKKQMAQRFRE